MIEIKEEFKKLIPALTAEEFKQLEENILKDGIRDPLVLWNGYLIDGHNRYQIAFKHGLEYKTIDKEFEDESQVKEWMINNQFGRRNLSNYQRSVLALELESVFSARAKEQQVRKPEFVLPMLAEQKPIDTRKELAKVANVSHGTLDKVKKIQAVATPEVKAQLSTGEVSINQIYQDIKKKETTLILEEKKKQNAIDLTNEVFENKPTVYHLDCNIFLNTLDDDSIDLLITDPPYSTDIKDINEFANSWVNLALSKVKTNGRAYICIGGYPKEINAYLNILLKQNKFIVDNPLIWSYKNTLGITPKMKYNLNYQVILHLYSETSKELDTSITSEMWNVMEINAPDGRLGNRYHTWQKPDELALRLIKHSTKENDLIIDCFACTGTFLLMGSKLNRNCKGCDIDINNLQIAKERGCIIIGK